MVGGTLMLKAYQPTPACHRPQPSGNQQLEHSTAVPHMLPFGGPQQIQSLTAGSRPNNSNPARTHQWGTRCPASTAALCPPGAACRGGPACTAPRRQQPLQATPVWREQARRSLGWQLSRDPEPACMAAPTHLQAFSPPTPHLHAFPTPMPNPRRSRRPHLPALTCQLPSSRNAAMKSGDAASERRNQVRS